MLRQIVQSGGGIPPIQRHRTAQAIEFAEEADQLGPQGIAPGMGKSADGATARLDLANQAGKAVAIARLGIQSGRGDARAQIGDAAVDRRFAHGAGPG